MISSDLVNALSYFDASQAARKIGPAEGPHTDLGSVGVRFLIWGEESGGGFSLVEHPIPPKTLVAPVHRHSREDEYSFVIEGRMGALLGDEVVYAEEGDLAFKPRNQWHTFWNPEDTPCRILEIIAPGGFEHFFREFGNAIEASAGAGPTPEQLADFSDRYGIEFDFNSVPRMCNEHGLTHPMLDAMNAAA